MAKKLQLDSALRKGKFAKIEHISKEGTRELRAYFLIVCEGAKTEPNYFKSFPKMAGSLVFDLTFDGGGISTTKVLEKAIEIRNKSSQKFDRIWIVFDKDSFDAGKFNKAIIDAKSKNISCAWSNEAFELWYLLHFVNRTTAMGREDYEKALEREVNKQIAAKTGSKSTSYKYKKNDKSMYQTLKTYGSETNAIKWAKALRTANVGEQYAKYNPCTMVYELVEELNGKSKKLIEEINRKYETGE